MHQPDKEKQRSLWIEYVRRKRAWEAENRDYSSKEHTAAMQRIARSLGV